MNNKTTMPEPLRLRWNKYTGRYDISEDHRAAGDADLITTTQAEAYKDACVREALEALNNQAQELYESSLKSRLTRDGAADEDELKAIDLWNVESVGMAKAYTNMQKAIRALMPKGSS